MGEKKKGKKGKREKLRGIEGGKSDKIIVDNNYIASLVDFSRNQLIPDVQELQRMDLPAKPLYWLTKTGSGHNWRRT